MSWPAVDSCSVAAAQWVSVDGGASFAFPVNLGSRLVPRSQGQVAVGSMVLRFKLSVGREAEREVKFHRAHRRSAVWRPRLLGPEDSSAKTEIAVALHEQKNKNGHRGVGVGEASHAGPELRRLRRGCDRNVVPRVGDKEDVAVTNDEEDVPVSALETPATQPASFVPTWADFLELATVAMLSNAVPRPGVLQSLGSLQSIPRRELRDRHDRGRRWR